MASNGTPSVPSKRKSPSDEDWESACVKSDVFRIYILEAQTLDKTMTEIERLHGLKTTKRKWKEMLENWDFKKNIRTYVWQWMCSKRATRRTQEDKETAFHYRHYEITPEMLEEFENRKIGIAHAVVATPKDVRYFTPCSTEADSSPEEMCERLTPSHSTPSETSSTFLDNVRHLHSLCSYGSEAATDRTSKTELPPRSLDKPIDRWLSDEHQPWSPFNLPDELSDDEDMIINHEDILGEFRGLEDPFQERGDLPELRCIGTQSFLEDAANDVISLTGEFEQYKARHAKHTPQALTVRFNLAQALERIGKHDEAENHYRKILSIESRINVQTSLGMILAKSGRLEGSATLLFHALTGFIVYFGSYSLLEIEWLFDLIFELFVETVSRRDDEKWDPFSEYMDQMMATLRKANSDEEIHRIWPQLFMHGFSFAHQCYILGVIRSAKCLYKYLLECPTVHFDNPHHQFEKFKAHYMYGLLLRKEKMWKSSAKQLLLACKSVMESGSYDRRLIRLFGVIFSHLRPHLASQLDQEDTLADEIEAILARMWNEVPAPKHPHDSWVENYLQSDLPRDVANFDLSDPVISNHFAQLTLPVRSAASSRIDKDLSTTASITRTSSKSIWANLSESLSGYESHKLASTFSDEENFGVSDRLLESQKS